MKAKGILGFVLFLLALCIIWTIYDFMSTITTSMHETWTPEATSGIANGIGSLVKFGGFMIVALLGLAGYNMLGGINWSSRSTGNPGPQLIEGDQYLLGNNSYPRPMLGQSPSYPAHIDGEFDLMSSDASEDGNIDQN